MFTIAVEDAQVRAALTRLHARLTNMAPAMADVARALRNHTEDAFQGERSPFGGAWPALSATYVARPVARGGRGGDAHPILQRDGQLAASITSGSNRDSAWVGAGKEYAAIHQFGGTPDMAPGPAAIPARPFLPVDAEGRIPEDLRTEVLEIVADYLSGAL